METAWAEFEPTYWDDNPLTNAWSDEARAAALETRRANAKGKLKEATGAHKVSAGKLAAAKKAFEAAQKEHGKNQKNLDKAKKEHEAVKMAKPGSMRQPKEGADIGKHAKNIEDLVKRANTPLPGHYDRPAMSHEQVRKELDDMHLEKLSRAEVHALAKKIGQPVNSGTSKAAAIDVIHRKPLLVQGMLEGART